MPYLYCNMSQSQMQRFVGSLKKSPAISCACFKNNIRVVSLKFLRICRISLLGLFINPGQAAEVAAWDVAEANLNNGLQSAPYTFDATTIEGILNAELTLGAGVNPSTAAKQYGFKVSAADAQTSLAGAIDKQHYIQFTLTADPGYVLNLSELNFNGESSSTGATHVAILSDIAGFTETAALATVTSANITGGFDTDSSGFGAPIDLSDAAYQNISSVTFRIYGWNSSSGSGTTALRNLTGNDLVIHGTAAPVPEPEALTLITGMVSAVCVLRRRRVA